MLKYTCKGCTSMVPAKDENEILSMRKLCSDCLSKSNRASLRRVTKIKKSKRRGW